MDSKTNTSLYACLTITKAFKVFTLGLGLTILAVLAPLNSVKAQESAGDKIAIVDIQGLLQKSKAAVSIQDQLKEQRQSFQKEFSKYEEKLQSAKQELGSQRSSLSAEEFSKKREDFEEKLIETRSIVQKKKKALDEALKNAMKELRIEILEIVADIADEKDLKLVISRQNVIVVDKGIDITSDVLKRLDKSLKSVDLDVKVN